MKKVFCYLTAIGMIFLSNGYAKAEVKDVACYDSKAPVGGLKNQIVLTATGSLTKFTIYLNGKEIKSSYTNAQTTSYPYTITDNPKSYVKISWTTWPSLLNPFSYKSGTTPVVYCQ